MVTVRDAPGSRPKSPVTRLPGVLDRLFLEIVAEREVAQHLEEGQVPGGVADIVEVVVLAAGADALLRRGGARRGRDSAPVKMFLNGTMPALTNSNVGSFCGTSGAEGSDHVIVRLAK